MSRQDEEPIDLDNWILTGLDNFSTAFSSVWQLDSEHPPAEVDPDEWLERKRLFILAEHLAGAARSLIRPEHLADSDFAAPSLLRTEAEAEERVLLEEWLGGVRDAFESIGSPMTPEQREILMGAAPTFLPPPARVRWEFFLRCMEFRAAEAFITFPGKMAPRMVTLLAYLMRDPGQRTEAYLSRVAECYIRGMTSEFAIMTRAVLEAALEEILSGAEDDANPDESNGKKIWRPGVSRLVRKAVSSGVLNEDQGAAAIRIVEAGNQAVHRTPGLEPDPEAILEDMALVLQRVDHLRRPPGMDTRERRNDVIPSKPAESEGGKFVPVPGGLILAGGRPALKRAASGS